VNNVDKYNFKSEKGSIKVLHIVLSLEPGGMENGLVNVAKLLHNNGFDLYICCLERIGDFAERFPDKSKIILLNKPPGISFKTVYNLSRLIKNIKPDIVHTHNFGPLIYTSMAKLIQSGFKLLHGEHGMIKNEDSGKLKLLLRKFCYAKCDLIHTVSEGLKNHFIQSGFPEQKIIAIKNGVDTQKFTPGDKFDVRKKLSIPDNAIVLGIVGRFDSGKRHSILIEVFNQIASKSTELYLLMVGEGGDNCQKVKELVYASPYKDRILTPGFQKDMLHYYRAMDLLVIPSLKEGFPNVLLESMACGIPAIAHPTPGTIETIKNGYDGVITNLENKENIKITIENAITNLAKLKSMGINARLKIESMFSLEIMAENYAKVYKILVNK